MFQVGIILIMKLLLLIMPFLLFAKTPFNTKVKPENIKAMENEKIKCRWVCDKKIYKDQKIAEAISFYRNSKYYKFNKKDF